MERKVCMRDHFMKEGVSFMNRKEVIDIIDEKDFESSSCHSQLLKLTDTSSSRAQAQEQAQEGQEQAQEGQVFNLAILDSDMYNIFHCEAVKDRI